MPITYEDSCDYSVSIRRLPRRRQKARVGDPLPVDAGGLRDGDSIRSRRVFRLGASPYIAFAFAGAFVVHMAMRPSRRELAVVVACAAMFGAAYFLLHADVTNFYGAAIGISGGFLGLGSLLLVTLQWFWAPAAETHAT